MPRELQPEVHDGNVHVPPVVMSHCLRFLCYHHLHNIVNRQQSLRDIYLTIKERYFVSANCDLISHHVYIWNPKTFLIEM
jgi:hypothetical protein